MMLPIGNGDTFTARMLRELADRHEWSQADFMRRYHEVCARPNQGRSSFWNNFGRFDVGRTRWLRVGSSAVYTDARPSLRCIHRTHQGARVLLRWAWLAPDVIPTTLAVDELQRAEFVLERVATVDARTDEDIAHGARWLARIRRAMGEL